MAATATPGVICSRTRILVASADAAFRKRILNDPAYANALGEEAIGGAQALAKLMQFPCDGVLLDQNLPDLDAREVAEQIRKQYPRVEVKLMDSRAGITEARKSGAGGGCESREGVDSTAEAEEPGSRAPETATPSAAPLPGMIGSSRAMEQVYRLVHMVAGRDTAVLVTGETGTGKELVARAIPSTEPARAKPFCGGELRGDSGSAAGGRIVRVHAWSVYRSGAIASGKSACGAGWDPVSG